MHNTNRHAPPIRFKSGGDDETPAHQPLGTPTDSAGRTSPAAASKKQPKKDDAGSLAKEEVGALSKADQRKLLKDLMDSPGRDDVKC